MKGSIYLHIGGDQCVIAYSYPVVVKEGAIHIDKAVFAEKNISSDIGVKIANGRRAVSTDLREAALAEYFVAVFTHRQSLRS